MVGLKGYLLATENFQSTFGLA